MVRLVEIIFEIMVNVSNDRNTGISQLLILDLPSLGLKNLKREEYHKNPFVFISKNIAKTSKKLIS